MQLSLFPSVPTSPHFVKSPIKRSHHRPASLSQSPSTATKPQPQHHIDPALVPRHLAIIPDGNVRWARQRRMPDSAGHVAGAKTLKDLTKLCLQWRIPVLSVFVFSCDNWSRSATEVNLIFNICKRVLERETGFVQREGVRVSFIGDLSSLPPTLSQMTRQVGEATKDNGRLHLVVAINYSGKRDIVKACKAVSERVQKGELRTEDIDERTIEEQLENCMCEFSSPDLLIRTSGEQRLSNFLLWQVAYTELLFVPNLWPDFGEDEFLQALATFQTRKRRYGGRSS